MRELHQLCFALAKIAEDDLAKVLYRNATREKQALLRVLHQHLQAVMDQSESSARHEERHEAAMQQLYDSLLDIARVSGVDSKQGWKEQLLIFPPSLRVLRRRLLSTTLPESCIAKPLRLPRLSTKE